MTDKELRELALHVASDIDLYNSQCWKATSYTPEWRERQAQIAAIIERKFARQLFSERGKEK